MGSGQVYALPSGRSTATDMPAGQSHLDFCSRGWLGLPSDIGGSRADFSFIYDILRHFCDSRLAYGSRRARRVVRRGCVCHPTTGMEQMLMKGHKAWQWADVRKMGLRSSRRDRPGHARYRLASTSRIIISTMITTMGLKSRPPKEGSSRLMGANTGSVIWFTARSIETSMGG